MANRSEKRTFEDQFIVDKQDTIIDKLTNLNGLVNFDYDGGSLELTDTVTEKYIFTKNNVIVGTIILVYTDVSKSTLLTFNRV